MADTIIDQAARDKANEAAHDIKNHILVTAIRLDNLDKKIDMTHSETKSHIDRLESILKWAGGLIVMLFISTLTWSLAQQYNANETTKKDLSAQVELLKAQQQNSLLAKSERREILNRLSPGTTQPAGPPDTGGQ